VPDTELDALKQWGFDAIWLMGVWERSAAGRKIAQELSGLQEEYRRTLPDYQPEDVVGSPYCIRRYEVDAHLGGKAALAAFRKRLAERGLRLMLDFVPNHVAVDHPWLASNPEYFIQGTADDLAAQPDAFFRPAGSEHGIAHGRDPYFPAWTDTAQLNAFSPDLRACAVETLLDIAAQCDGVRCDMAMLVTNPVFARTWGERAGKPPDVDYWRVVIPTICARNPDFLFVAEVYWDLEWELQQQGFNYTYDKRLYDRLVSEPARVIVPHLYADSAYQRHMIRFIENHDERRATMALGPGRDLAAAALIATLPGATLFHEGQCTGHQIKLPIQLGRRPPEPVNNEVEKFYRTLIAEAHHPVYREGEWQLRDTIAAWDLNASHRALIAYTWRRGDDRRLIVVNYSPASAQGRVPLPDFDLRGHTWHLYDVVKQVEYERDGSDMAEHGLYVDLVPWQAHIFVFRDGK
jgi:glycosidase